MKRLCMLVLLLILCFTLVLTSNVGNVEAQDTIYIRADGSVEGTDKIQRDGNIYTFSGNIVNQSINVKKDNIVVNGVGYTIEGDGKLSAIWLENRSNVTIKNIQITHFGEGIRIMGNCQNNTIIENNITDIGHETFANAIWVTFGASNTTISRNNISGNHVGILVYLGGVNIISENCITENRLGVWIIGSGNQILRNNVTNNNEGISIGSSNNIIYRNNFVNNTVQVDVDENSSSINEWDNGVEGNYWDDYTGTDNDGDGIGETPYIIDLNNQDNYPLVKQYIIPEFPLWIILPLILTSTLFLIIVKRKLHNVKAS